MYQSLALMAGFVLFYSVIAGRIERSWVSGAMVSTAFGLAVGPVGLDLLSFETDRETIETLAELTLALVLFSDAAGANLGVLRRSAGLPVRLLLVGLPLTIGLGYLAAQLLDLSLSPIELALLATILAPTDAALGKAVVTNESVPANVRESLNLESGLNDGICVPILFVFLAMAQEIGLEQGTWSLAAGLAAHQIGIGLVVGVVLTAVVVKLLDRAEANQWLTPTWIQVPVVALSVACFATAQALGGSGFIAAFAGGLLFDDLERTKRERYIRAAEGTGDTFGLITWVIFGSAVIGQAVGQFTWRSVLYAVLSLTVVRMLPVFLVLTGSGLQNRDKLFMGWFGPRGLASIVFAIIVLDANLPNSGAIAAVVVCAVGLSILAHGMTANPWASMYENRSGRE